MEELWEREIVAIQRNIFLSTQCVLLIEPHSGLRDMLCSTIGLLGKHYRALPMSFEEAQLWLQERECEQTHPSIVLFDCFHTSPERDQFLCQLQKTKLFRPLRTIGMTLEPSSLSSYHVAIDYILPKPFRLKELRAYIFDVLSV